MNKVLALSLALPTIISAAGCATEIDADKAQTEISKAVRIQAGVQVKSVSCPAGVKAKKGGTFECKVTAKDGTTGQVEVTQRDDKGNIVFNAPFIHTDEAEAAIVSQMEQQTGVSGIEVDCPDIIVGKVGAPFECKGTAGSRSFVVKATQTDANGRFTFKVAQ